MRYEASLRALILMVLAVAACADPGGDDVVSAGRCTLTAWYRPNADAGSAQAELIGSWNGWQEPGLDAWQRRGEWRGQSVRLPAGTHQYAIVEGGRMRIDEQNPQTMFRSMQAPYDTEVSTVDIPDCSQPALEVTRVTGGRGDITVELRFLRGENGPPLDERSITVDGEIVSREAGHIVVRRAGLAPGKYTLTIGAADRAGRAAPAVSASGFVEAAPARPLGDGLVYQIVIDRFRNADGPLAPPATPGRRAGGTLDGVRAAIDAGYFEQLGVTTLWLSPVYQNLDGEHIGRDGNLYEAYHGYWPSQPRSVEPKIGGEAALEATVAAAHARGLRVIVDAVPNHVANTHPYFVEHAAASGDSWFNDGPTACVCGAPGCGWGERIEDCWFDKYLPDLNWRHPAVLEQGTADLVWWMQRFDLDGLRIDAVPMMPRAATRRIVRAVRESTRREGLDRLIIGENYTGAGDGGREQLRAYLGDRLDGLDSEFDFPIMWAMREVIAHSASGFDALEREIAASAEAFEGSGAVMATIIGNHDTTRFFTESIDEPYRRQLLAMTLALTLPGLPVIYYGDEVGLEGGSDPDCRRVLPDVLQPETLPAAQRQLLAQVTRLAQLRRCSPSLRGARRRPLFVDRNHVVALHDTAEPVIVALSRDRLPARVDLHGIPDGAYVDALSNDRITVRNGTVTVELRPLSPAVYLPEASTCK